MVYSLFFFNHTATTEIYTLSLHDALPISRGSPSRRVRRSSVWRQPSSVTSIRARHHGLFPGAPQAQRRPRAVRRPGKELAQRQPHRRHLRGGPQATYGSGQTLLAAQDPRLLVVIV